MLLRLRAHATSLSSIMKTVTNEASFLNAQMRQIDADGEKDKQTAQELERPCLARRSTVVEALVPRACERQAVDTTASTTAPGPPFDCRRLVFNVCPSVSSADCSTNPRRFEAKLR